MSAHLEQSAFGLHMLQLCLVKMINMDEMQCHNFHGNIKLLSTLTCDIISYFSAASGGKQEVKMSQSGIFSVTLGFLFCLSEQKTTHRLKSEPE